MQTNTTEVTFKGKLVTAEQLLEALFDPEARPSMRWLRTMTKAKAIPFIKIGRLVFFDLEMVKEALARKHMVRHRLARAVNAAV